MKTWLKHTLFLLSVAVLCAGAFVIRHAWLGKCDPYTCSDIRVSIEGDREFITEDEVKGYISSHFGKCIGKQLDSIALYRIEKMLDDQSAVLKSQVWVTSDGLMHVSVSQRNPVARFEKSGSGFYIDDRGYIFPLHPTYTAPVPVFRGAIPVRAGGNYKGRAASAGEREWINGVMDLVDYIGKGRMWRGRFQEMTVTAGGDIILIPEEWSEKYIIGGTDNLEAKFSRIAKFRSEIAPAWEEGHYKTVNVKYDGQIVCRQH